MNDVGASALYEQLPQLGRPGAAKGAQLVRSNEAAWFVECGNVDVFVVAASGEEPVGARRYLFSVGAGQLLAFPRLAPGRREVLVAVPGPRTRYRVVERATLAAPAFRPALARMLDGLAASIGAGFGQRPPLDSVTLHAGARHEVAGALALAPEAGGVWVELESGDAALAGGAALAPGQALPLPAGCWVTLAAGSALASCTSLELAERGGVAALLDGTERLFLALFEAALSQQRRDDAGELARLRARSAIGNRMMADALAGLASVSGSSPRDAGSAGEDRVLAACRLVGQYQGIDFKAPPPVDGSAPRDLVKEIAHVSNVRTRRVALKAGWWTSDNGPLLGRVASTRLAYALLPLRGGGYEAVDPCTGARQHVDDAFAQTLAPFALTFYASLPARILGLADIVRFVLRGAGRDLVVVAAIGAASAVLAMAIPVASGYLFDAVFPAADHEQMVLLVVVLFVAALVTLLFDVTRALAMLRVEARGTSDLQAAVWDRVLALPAPFFRTYSAGDLATRINGINEIRQALSGALITTLVSGLFSMLNVFLLFYYHARLALVAVGLVAVAVAVNMGIGWMAARVTWAAGEAGGKVAGLVLEYLSGIGKLRFTGSEARAFANWAAAFAAQKRLYVRAGSLDNVSAVFGAAFPVAANALIFACIAASMAGGDARGLSTGAFIAFSAAWTVLLNAALALVRTGSDLLAIRAVYRRTTPILQAIPEVDPAKPHPGALGGAIELSNLSFAYSPDAPPVLDDVSVSIKPGEFVALVGASGSGKSTLLRLMLGFEKPASGGVYYDGHNLNEIDVGAVRRQLGVVLQGGRLMSGDIYSNIVGSAMLTPEDAWEAAAACGLDEEIRAMPMGMFTLVSDGGATLSGGQRQRLLIARAIVNKPRIVFFDEATSALDNQSQATVSASLEKLRATRVVIAHRLSTIIHADRIIMLDRGRVVQCGTYQELLAQDGLFTELAKRQMA